MRGRVAGDRLFMAAVAIVGGSYAMWIVLLLVANAWYARTQDYTEALSKAEIQYSIALTIFSCTASAILAVLVAIPLGYLLSRFKFFGSRIIDVLIDLPLVLPPLVIGLSLLILFHIRLAPNWMTLEEFCQHRLALRVTYHVPSVILAQFTVAAAFAVRTLRLTFDQINPRTEHVALTLGCSRRQAFWLVALPQAWRGIVTGFTVAWARSLGEFGPILVFSGATRMKTEVLSTTVFLELSVGSLGAAAAVSMIMVAVATGVLLTLTALRERQAPA